MSSARCPFFVPVTFVRPFSSCRASLHLQGKHHKTQHKQIWGTYRLPSIHRWRHHFHHHVHYSRTSCILSDNDHQDDCAPLPAGQPSSLEKREQSTVDNRTEQAVHFWIGAQFEVMVGLVGYLLCALFDLSILGPHFSLGKTAIFESAGASVLFCMLFWAVELLPGHSTKIGIVTSDKLFRSLFEQRGIRDIALFCMCVAIGEEVMFRSCLLNGLCKLGLPPLLALMLSAFIFGLFHGYSKVYVALASLAGFLFGAMYLQAASLFQPVFVHFMYDFLTIMFMKLRWRFRKTNEEDEQQQQQQQQQ